MYNIWMGQWWLTNGIWIGGMVAPKQIEKVFAKMSVGFDLVGKPMPYTYHLGMIVTTHL